jgi:hypothetical protein
MNETKVTHSIADTVEAYRKQQVEIAEREAIETERARQETMEALTASGLIPLRIEERNLAIFEYEGQEVKLRIFKSGYWQVIRQDICKDCGAELRTYEKAWTAENIGELVVNPSYEYHWCRAKAEQSTSEENLISVLRDALGLNDNGTS